MNKKSTTTCHLFFLSDLFIVPALISEIKIQRRRAEGKVQMCVSLFSVSELSFIPYRLKAAGFSKWERGRKMIIK
jgi:hypothetical protein